MESDRLFDYYEAGHCSVQWQGFMRALAGEFAEALPAHDLKRLMMRIGTRYAAEHPLEDCDSLDQWASAVNARWRQSDFGYAVFKELPLHLEIAHYAEPLTLALGPDSAAWAVGFLEGVYQAWFMQAGMGTGLEVHADDVGTEQARDRSTRLRLARAAKR